MNHIKTKNYYRTVHAEDICSCEYCRNYCKEIKGAYPVLSAYLAGLGIDIEKPFEAFPLEPYEGAIEYAAVQYIVMGNGCDFEALDVSGVHICLAASHPVTNINEEHFVLEIAPVKLKWTIQSSSNLLR